MAPSDLPGFLICILCSSLGTFWGDHKESKVKVVIMNYYTEESPFEDPPRRDSLPTKDTLLDPFPIAVASSV